MNNFVLNVVRRGAGLAPSVMLRSRLPSTFSPNLSAAQDPELAMAQTDPAMPETPVPGPRVSAWTQRRWANEAVPEPSQASNVPPAPRVLNPAERYSPRPGTETPDARAITQRDTGDPSFIQVDGEAIAPPFRTGAEIQNVQAFAQDAVLMIQPVTSIATDSTPTVLKPAPIAAPAHLQLAKSALTPAEPRPVQVRIGTIEVRATTPPAPTPRPATTPQGFDDYALVRNYVNWGQY
jgi:hypothetical protein